MKDYKRLTEKSIGCFKYILKDHKPKAGEFNDYDAFYNYSTAVKILGELENKIERREPLANIGDSVYQRDNAGNIYKSTIKKIIYETDGIAFDDSAIGQSVFLSEEDLKNKLLEDKSQ